MNLRRFFMTKRQWREWRKANTRPVGRAATWCLKCDGWTTHHEDHGLQKVKTDPDGSGDFFYLDQFYCISHSGELWVETPREEVLSARSPIEVRLARIPGEWSPQA